MIGIILLFAASTGVQAQFRPAPNVRPMSPTLNQAVMIAEPLLRKQSYPEVIAISQTVLPNNVPTSPVVPPMPVIPFLTELPNCPDFCFTDLLRSPLGCLDPILNVYGSATEVIKLDLPVSPLLPAASPVSAISPFSKLLPPVQPGGYDSLFTKRIPIPPPFI